MNPREYRALFSVEDRHWWFVALRREISRALSRYASHDGPTRRWLDAGSGTGGLLANLDWDGMRVGVEVSAIGLGFARSRSLSDLVRASVSSLPFTADAFDAVTSVDVLCHRDVVEETALAEAYRCLKPGGLLVLQVPAFDWLRGEHDAAVWTNRRYRRGEIERLVRDVGFDIKESFYRLTLLFPLAILRRLFRRGGRPGEERSDVAPVTPAADRLLGAILRAENSLGGLGLRLPFGLSVFCVAQKRASSVLSS